MSGHSRLSSSRGREEAERKSERIPKKPKIHHSNDGGYSVTRASYTSEAVATNDDDDKNKICVTADDDPLDAAKKALMKFQEITGEPSTYIFDSAASKGKACDAKFIAHRPNNDTHDGSAFPQQNGNRKLVEGSSDDSTTLKEQERKRNEERETCERQEEEVARRKQRVEEGAAKRRAFKPKIATAMDTLL
jgi:hypothetical protein